MNRHEKLITKVGKYYFLYKSKKIDNIDSIFRSNLTLINVDEITRSYLFLSLFKSIITNVLREFEIAKKDELTYREYTVEYDRDVHGELTVPQTISVFPQGLYAYYTFREGRNAREYAILNYLLHRIYNIASNFFNKIKNNVEKIEYFRKKIDSIRVKLDKLYSILDYFKGEYFRPITAYDPTWLRNVYEDYIIMADLEKAEFGIKGEVKIDRKTILISLWKLYEIYVFFLLANFLESIGYEISYNNNIFVAKKGNKKLDIYLNSSLSSSTLVSVNDFHVEQFKGRPDISISNSNSIIIECKYSTNVSYITASRFKIMAYAYEYDPLTVILAYPGLNENGNAIDIEEEATIKLDQYIRNNGYVDFNFRNGKKLFLMILDPARDDIENIKNIRRIFDNYPNLKNFI
ncbi:hypothetical protein [Acidianus manzaensis]|uniref:Uncharacterized protein n=1 Tax=Acidianus manzaensis TaxID=282676 RepID=A0A1W6K2R8_9CREN|nr:hypothetical protein [Acidianus manzaensis]ARM76841.1 hypothetical protein B6F84_12980 [Acidianus manzaensis]